MAQSQYTNINGLQVERAKYKYYKTPYGYMAAATPGEQENAKLYSGGVEMTYEEAQNAQPLASGYQVSDAFKKAVSDVYSSGMVNVPENLRGQVGTDWAPSASIQDLIKGQEYANNPAYKNIGTSTAPLYMLKGSAGDINLQNPTNVLNQPANPVSSNQPKTPEQMQMPVQQDKTLASNYKVKSGDTLSKIAQQMGVNVSDISGYRSGNPNLIYPDEVLTIKKGQSTQNQSQSTQVPQSMVDTMGQVNQMIGNISKGVQELGGQGVITPQTPIIPEVGSTAITTSDGPKNAENQKKIDEAKKLAEQANSQQSTIQDLTNQKTIADLQTALGTKPATPNFTSNYEALRSQNGVADLETRMNDLKAQKLTLQDSLQMGLDKVSNKLEPMELIGPEQQAIQAQAQNKINAIDRDLAQVQDEYNTKINVISNLMQLQQTDYANAVNNYNTQFSQTLQLQDLLSTQQDRATSQANAQRDTSKANITLIMNTLQGSGTSWDKMDSSLKTELQSLGLKAGFTTLEMQAMFNNLGTGEKQQAVNLVTDANGNQSYSILTMGSDGVYYTSTMPTGGVNISKPISTQDTTPALTAAQQNAQADQLENTRIKNELTNSGQRDYVSQGYYDQVKASQTLYTASAFDDKFGYLLTGRKLTDDEKKKGLKWLTKNGATQADKDKFESDGKFQKWVLNQK